MTKTSLSHNSKVKKESLLKSYKKHYPLILMLLPGIIALI